MFLFTGNILQMYAKILYFRYRIQTAWCQYIANIKAANLHAAAQFSERCGITGIEPHYHQLCQAYTLHSGSDKIIKN